ncbi:MAG: hypothetical protein K0S65_3984 [Labilithrix sp.]|nr:hypothetical protein [Labilithrix sp.]
MLARESIAQSGAAHSFLRRRAALGLVACTSAFSACGDDSATHDAASGPASSQQAVPSEGGSAGNHVSDSAEKPDDKDAGDAEASADTGAPADCGAFPAAANLSSAGPFGSTSAAEGPNCTIIRPTALGQGGVKHPVILWGNGTNAMVSLYKSAFELWASHGFIVAAANATNGQGAGTPLLECLGWVLEQDTTPGSTYQGKVCARAGATGHSQGGGGALMAGRDPRVRVTAPLQPYTQQGYGGYDQASITTQQGPMLLLSGTADNNATPSIHQKPVFEKTNVPVFWASLIGGDHYTPALGIPTYKTVMLAWFRLHLLGDEAFRAQFYGSSCAVCGDSKWTVQRRGIN